MPLPIGKSHRLEMEIESDVAGCVRIPPQISSNQTHFLAIPFGPLPRTFAAVGPWGRRLIPFGAVVVHCGHSVANHGFNGALQLSWPVAGKEHLSLAHERRMS